MKKPVRILLLTLGALVAVLLLAAVALTFYVQSPGTQSKIEDKLSRSLGMPFKISGLSVLPWGVLRVKSARIPQTDANAGSGNFLEAGSFHARFRVLPLLAGRLEITSVKLEEPKVKWTQDAQGKWRLPALAKPEKAAPAKTKSATSNPPLDFAIARFRVEGGAFDFLDAKQQRVASFADLSLHARAVTGHAANGSARCESAKIQDVVLAKNFRTHFNYETGKLTLDDLTGDVAGGRVTGVVRLDSDKPHSPFAADLRLENLDANRLLVEGGGEPGQLSGTLEGTVDFYGDTHGTDTAGGSGRLVLRHGHIRGNEILQLIGQVLQIEELSRLDLTAGQVDFRIGDGKIWVDSLVLDSPNLQLTVHGTIRLDDQKIAAEARLSLHERGARKIPDLIRKQLLRTDGAGGNYLDFALKGSLKKPRTDLAERIIGGKIQEQFGGLIELLTGKKKDKEKKPKKKDQPETPPVPPAPVLTPLPPPNPDPEPKEQP